MFATFVPHFNEHVHLLKGSILKYRHLAIGITPCKAEQPPQGMELQKKNTKRLQHTGNLFRKNLQLIGDC